MMRVVFLNKTGDILMEIFKWKVDSPEETINFAKQLGEKLQPGDVLTLEGDLGAGKTTFTKGIAKGLGIRRTVNSPTFTIVKEYIGRIPLYHMDVYRLENSDEDIGFDEYFNGDGVSVVEWAKFIEAYLPQHRLEIQLEYLNDNERNICLKPIGTHYETLCKELSK